MELLLIGPDCHYNDMFLRQTISHKISESVEFSSTFLIESVLLVLTAAYCDNNIDEQRVLYELRNPSLCSDSRIFSERAGTH